MGLSVGIVGLPNVGKSTFFSLITKSQTEIANYPFATINPSVGIANIIDDRIQFLEKIYHPKKTVFNYVKFTDIAGLVRGASKGKGLGNQFLSNIRECDAICEVVRCFENKNVLHVEGRIDPLQDVIIIHEELILSDLEVIESILSKIKKKAAHHPDLKFEYDTLVLAKGILEKEQTLDLYRQWTKEQIKVLNKYQMLTIKKKFFVINVSENEFNEIEQNPVYQKITTFLKGKGWEYIKIALKFELDLADIEDEESRNMFKEEFNIQGSVFQDVVNLGLRSLNLKTFYTAGPQEVRAWTFIDGETAKKCASYIHSDIEQGFIKAEIFSIDDLREFQSEKGIKEKGKLRVEGKDYKMRDSDVCYFHFKK